MDKAHITMIGTYPVFMTHTYDSFLNHSDIWYHLNAKPIISYASKAVINEEGKEERIDHWVNKMWKIGGDIHATRIMQQWKTN